VGRYRSRRGVTSAAQTSLKFDVSGLNEFKTAVRGLKTEISSLRSDFRGLTKDTNDWVTALKKATDAMGKVRPGANYVSAGSLTGTSGNGASGGVKGGTTPFSGMGTGGVGAAAATAAAGIGGAVQGGINAAVNRWQGLQQVGAAWDVYGSRLATTTGVPSTALAGQLSKNAPFLGSATDMGQALLTLAAQGATYGTGGITGASGMAGAQGIKMLQALQPGLGAPQAAQSVTGFQSNIAQQRMSTLIFGTAAFSMNTATGQQKSLPDYFNGIFKAIQANRQGPNSNRPYTREEWTAFRLPGSPLMIQLSQWLGWDPDMINQFFAYAESQATTDPTGTRMFQGTQQQQQQVQGGKSLATAVQQTETKQGQSDLRAFSQNEGAMITQQQANQRLIQLQSTANDWLHDIYGVLSHAPGSLQGSIGNIVGNVLTGNWGGALKAGIGAISSIIGDYGYGDMGDSGFSQLNPDLKGRLGAMMQANPNIRLNSGYRTLNEQKRLWDSGDTRMAPPGKSRHGRGQAADLGPRSQLGWINANAKRFGLDTGANKGEPWHVQVAGTMQMGDFGTANQAIASFEDYAAAGRSAAISAVAQQLIDASGSTTPSGGTSSATGSTGSTGAPGATGSAGSATGPTQSTGANTGGSTLTGQDVAKLAYAAGFRGQDLINFVGIAKRESGFTTAAANDKGLDNSYGLWQINTQGSNLDNINRILGLLGVQGAGTRDQTKALLQKPDVNAEVAYYFWSHSGYGPWKPPKSLDPNQNPLWNVDVNTAKTYVESAFPSGYGDYGYGGGGGSGTANVNAPMTFNMTFNIAVNGGNGVDVNSLTRQIAAKLEPQIRRMQTTRR
jgi:hypothetical protein